MRRIEVRLSIGYPTACHDDVLEVEDDTPDNEIDQMVQEWAHNFINIAWGEE